MGNEGFKHLAALPNLKVLQIDYGDYTVDGVKELTASKSLEWLIMRFPHNISPAKVELVRKALPNVQVDYYRFD